MERQTEHQHEHAATDPMEASVQAEAHVTISDAARMTGASRTRLYRAIDGGRIQRSADGKVSIQSLLHAGFELKDGQSSATAPRDNLSYLLTHYTDMARQLNESLEAQIDALQEQLRFLQEQLRLSQQREAQLWQMLQARYAGAAGKNTDTRNEPQDAETQTHRMTLHNEPAEHRPSPAEQMAAVHAPPMPAAEPPGRLEPESRGHQAVGFFGRWNR